MATHDYIISNASGAAVRSDLNNALAAIVSNNSNATEPATTYAYMWWADTTNGQLKLRNAANSAWVVIQELDGTMLMQDGTVGAPGLAFASDLDTGIYRPTTNALGIATNGTAAIYVNASQQVGIGTTSPAAKLGVEVNGFDGINIKATTANQDPILSLTSPSTNYWNLQVDASVGDSFQWRYNNSEQLAIDSSGRLLVGTSSSSGSNALVVQGNSLGANQQGVVVIASDKSTFSSGDNYGTLSFSDNTHSRTASIEALVDGTFTAGSSRPARLVFSTTADGDPSPTEALRINNTGRLYSVPTYNGTTAIAANMYISSSGLMYRSTSSAKYKTDVETLEDAYADAILNIRPVWYRSTCEGDCPEHSHWGFIAEDVAQIDKRLVHWKTVDIAYDEKGSAVETPCDPEPDGVAYERFVPHLLNLIKRQKEQIEAMEARLSALEAS